MDITPLVPAGRQLIQSYGAGRFRVSGTVYGGPILVLPDRTLAWGVGDASELSFASLAPIVEAGVMTEVILFGAGRRGTFVPPGLRAELKAVGIVLEAMDTGAACRTFNVLSGEDRRVAAALIPL
jgi:uncharacterized protein